MASGSYYGTDDAREAVSLRWRIGISLALVALAIAGIASVVSYLGTAEQVGAGIDRSLRASAAAANATGDTAGGGRRGSGDRAGADGGSACGDAALVQQASAAQLVSASGVIVSCVSGGPVLPISAADRALSYGAVELSTVRADETRYRVLSTPWHDGGTLQIAESLSGSDSLLARLRFQLGALILGATVVAALAGWTIATRLTRPIGRLRATTHRIATTLDFSTPVDVGGPGEVGSLAASFSTLVAAVARSQDQQRRLVADASHEMRTPLTSLRSNVELFRRIEQLPSEERSDVVADVLEDVDELSTLLSELVVLASDLARSEPTETVHLDDLARTVAARVHRRTQRNVTVDVHDRTVVPGRPRQLERAIHNLVDNAVKYSPAGSPIVIQIDGPELTVHDRGGGVPDADLERIFDRFYRVVDARSRPGSGLGLSIVSAIVRSHGGRVSAANRPGGGASVGFVLPGVPA